MQKVIGKEINRLRQEANMSEKELIKAAKITHQQLLKIEDGTLDVKISTLLRILKSLNQEISISARSKMDIKLEKEVEKSDSIILSLSDLKKIIETKTERILDELREINYLK